MRIGDGSMYYVHAVHDGESSGRCAITGYDMARLVDRR